MTPVQRARSFVGCPFRPQGRDASTGFDCVGLVCAAHLIDAENVSHDYRLRGSCAVRLLEQLERFFWTVPVSDAGPGDVVLLQPRVDLIHLGILTDRGMIHADARLRKVIETPRISAWPILSAHRRTTSE